MDISREAYLQNPCRFSSIPFWKAQNINVPEGMAIVHHEDYDAAEYAGFADEPYFRLAHNLQDMPDRRVLPEYAMCAASFGQFAAHINECYSGACVTEAEIRSYSEHSVYDSDLWIAVRKVHTGEIVATGIAEFDRETGEGILEWIQVSKAHRGCGLGGFVVCELLRRLKGRADFVTVSGRCNNPSKPENLYRKCGFSGNDIWHVLRKY